MKRWLIGLSSLVGALVVVYWVSGSFLNNNRATRDRPKAIREPELEAQQTPQRYAVHSSELVPAVVNHDHGPEPEDKGVPAAPLRDAAQEQKPEVTEDERRAYAASTFDAELFDPAWAPAARQALESKLASVAKPSVRVGKVECRRELCRFETEAPQDDEAAYLRDLVRSGIGAGMAIRSDPDTSGKIVTTIYVAPKGTPLPEPPTE